MELKRVGSPAQATTTPARLRTLPIFAPSPSGRVGGCGSLVHRCVQRAELRSVAILRPRRYAEVAILPGQLDNFSEVELRVPGKAGQQKRLRVEIPGDGEFPGEQPIHSL